MARRKPPQKPPTDSVNVPIKISADLNAAIGDAARQVKLSKQDVMRLSMERGLSILIAQLTNEPVTHPG